MGVAPPDLSIVIPVYNGAAFLDRSLDRVETFLDRNRLDAEIVTVDDGSTDGTAEILAARPGDRLVRRRHDHNRGKYAALKTGMTVARGACRVFTDADIPYDLEAVPVMADLLGRGAFHIVVGDRTLAASEGGGEPPPLRRLGTKLFSFAVRILVTGELFDTQVGFKAFRGDVATAIFPLVTDDGFAGDVELLYIALKYNLAIRRIPVRLRRRGVSTVSLAGHSLPMLRRIAGLRGRWRRGGYHSAELAAIADQSYWADAADD
jgi:glycosyltransferase involved in cell wall biosynthesis